MRLGDLDALKKQMKELLDLAVKRVDDTPNNSPCYQMYVAQENERARLIDLIDNAPTVFSCNACKNMGNERECVDCHDYSNYVHYDERPQGEWKRHDEWRDGEYIGGFYHVNCPVKDGYYSKWEYSYCPNCGTKMRKGGAE